MDCLMMLGSGGRGGGNFGSSGFTVGWGVAEVGGDLNFFVGEDEPVAGNENGVQ